MRDDWPDFFRFMLISMGTFLVLFFSYKLGQSQKDWDLALKLWESEARLRTCNEMLKEFDYKNKTDSI